MNIINCTTHWPKHFRVIAALFLPAFAAGLLYSVSQWFGLQETRQAELWWAAVCWICAVITSAALLFFQMFKKLDEFERHLTLKAAALAATSVVLAKLLYAPFEVLFEARPFSGVWMTVALAFTFLFLAIVLFFLHDDPTSLE